MNLPLPLWYLNCLWRLSAAGLGAVSRIFSKNMMCVVNVIRPATKTARLGRILHYSFSEPFHSSKDFINWFCMFLSALFKTMCFFKWWQMWYHSISLEQIKLFSFAGSPAKFQAWILSQIQSFWQSSLYSSHLQRFEADSRYRIFFFARKGMLTSLS